MADHSVMFLPAVLSLLPLCPCAAKVKASVVQEGSRLRLWGAYPCQEALAKIGKPAQWRLIETLTGEAGDEVKAAALKVIQKIEGWRGAVFVLEQAWEGPDSRSARNWKRR